MREQVGEAALLMDLKNPSSMADHLAALISSEPLRLRLVEAGKKQLAKLNKCNRVNVLQTIIEEFRSKRVCWE